LTNSTRTLGLLKEQTLELAIDTEGNVNKTGIRVVTVNAPIYVEILPSQALTNGILFGTVYPNQVNEALNNRKLKEEFFVEY
jgi:hypothetical protein